MSELPDESRRAEPHRRVLITGGTGFIGRALVSEWTLNNHAHCTILTRNSARAATAAARSFAKDSERINFISYDDPFPESLDAVVNLAGETIVGLWTRAKRQRIIESRVNITTHLVERLRATNSPPRVFISASAVGIYGHRPGETLDEHSPLDPTDGFRAQVCRAWEVAARPAEDFIDRVICLRIGNAMDPSGGYLGSLLRIARVLRTVPVLGRRDSVVSWISLDDLARLINWCINEPSLAGVVNATAPMPTTQQSIADAAKLLIRRSREAGPVRLRLPGSFLRLALGEFARAIVDHQHIRPAAAEQAGFVFNDQDFDAFVTRIRGKIPY